MQAGNDDRWMKEGRKMFLTLLQMGNLFIYEYVYELSHICFMQLGFHSHT